MSNERFEGGRKMKKRLLVLLLVGILCAMSFAGCQSSSAGGESDEVVVGFAVSTLANDFFVTMNDAAVAKAEEMGIKLITLDAQDNAETQATQIEDFITKEVDILLVNPVDSDAVGTAVLAANEAGIPVITVTRPSNLGEVLQHLDIDNKEAGMLDAEQLVKDLGGKGKVAILEGIAGAPSALDRQAGFVDYLKENAPDIEVVTSLTANYSREEGASVTDDILQSNPVLDAIYAHNDGMALGAVRSVIAADRLAEIKIYGIDATADAVEAVKNGEMAATVMQQPDVQIHKALETAMKVLDGESVEAKINIPLKLITIDNAE
jgi:ribose transport system substrate-binding protein